MDKEILELEEKLKEKQQAEMSGEDKARALVDLAKEPEKMVRVAVSDRIANKVRSDEATKERIDKSADKLVNSGVATIENEAEASENNSERAKLQSYFDKHKDELKTAGIDNVTYMEDMQRGVKWHKRWSNFHWFLFGWWMTGVRTFIMRAKPFRIVLNVIAIVLSLGVLIGSIWGISYLIRLIAH